MLFGGVLKVNKNLVAAGVGCSIELRRVLQFYSCYVDNSVNVPAIPTGRWSTKYLEKEME